VFVRSFVHSFVRPSARPFVVHLCGTHGVSIRCGTTDRPRRLPRWL
jgi:hypothetical protein